MAGYQSALDACTALAAQVAACGPFVPVKTESFVLCGTAFLQLADALVDVQDAATNSEFQAVCRSVEDTYLCVHDLTRLGPIMLTLVSSSVKARLMQLWHDLAACLRDIAARFAEGTLLHDKVASVLTSLEKASCQLQSPEVFNAYEEANESINAELLGNYLKKVPAEQQACGLAIKTSIVRTAGVYDTADLVRSDIARLRDANAGLAAHTASGSNGKSFLLYRNKALIAWLEAGLGKFQGPKGLHRPHMRHTHASFQPPSTLCCPFCTQFMHCPVRLESDISMDSVCYEAWCRSGQQAKLVTWHCPVTGKTLSPQHGTVSATRDAETEERALRWRSEYFAQLQLELGAPLSVVQQQTQQLRKDLARQECHVREAGQHIARLEHLLANAIKEREELQEEVEQEQQLHQATRLQLQELSEASDAFARSSKEVKQAHEHELAALQQSNAQQIAQLDESHARILAQLENERNTTMITCEQTIQVLQQDNLALRQEVEALRDQFAMLGGTARQNNVGNKQHGWPIQRQPIRRQAAGGHAQGYIESKGYPGHCAYQGEVAEAYVDHEARQCRAQRPGHGGWPGATDGRLQSQAYAHNSKTECQSYRPAISAASMASLSGMENSCSSRLMATSVESTSDDEIATALSGEQHYNGLAAKSVGGSSGSTISAPGAQVLLNLAAVRPTDFSSQSCRNTADNQQARPAEYSASQLCSVNRDQPGDDGRGFHHIAVPHGVRPKHSTSPERRATRKQARVPKFQQPHRHATKHRLANCRTSRSPVVQYSDNFEQQGSFAVNPAVVTAHLDLNSATEAQPVRQPLSHHGVQQRGGEEFHDLPGLRLSKDVSSSSTLIAAATEAAEITAIGSSCSSGLLRTDSARDANGAVRQNATQVASVPTVVPKPKPRQLGTPPAADTKQQLTLADIHSLAAMFKMQGPQQSAPIVGLMDDSHGNCDSDATGDVVRGYASNTPTSSASQTPKAAWRHALPGTWGKHVGLLEQVYADGVEYEDIERCNFPPELNDALCELLQSYAAVFVEHSHLKHIRKLNPEIITQKLRSLTMEIKQSEGQETVEFWHKKLDLLLKQPCTPPPQDWQHLYADTASRHELEVFIKSLFPRGLAHRLIKGDEAIMRSFLKLCQQQSQWFSTLYNMAPEAAHALSHLSYDALRQLCDDCLSRIHPFALPKAEFRRCIMDFAALWQGNDECKQNINALVQRYEATLVRNL